jgi:hypothetical protein
MTALPNIPLDIPSEAVEPTMLVILATLLARCEAASDDPAVLHNQCNRLWEGIRAINMVAICLSGGSTKSESCVHFSIAASNEMSKVARYIRGKIGVDPYEVWWK